MSTVGELIRDLFFSIIFHVAPRFANVLTFILIGRLAGPSQAGVFSLATTYLLILTTVTRGLDDLVVRQVSREPERAPSYLTNFLLLRLGLSVLLYGMLALIVKTIMRYPAGTATPILLLGLSLLPESLAYVVQAVLMGKRFFGIPSLILAGANLFKLVVGGVALVNGGDLQHIAWIWLMGGLLSAIALFVIACCQIGGLALADWLDWRPLADNWRAAMPFLFITTLMTLEFQADIIILSAFRNQAEIGWYSAATTVAYSLTMFSQAFRFSVYPLMSRYAVRAPEKLTELYKRSLRYLGTLSLPMAAGVILLAPQIILLVFGPKFQPTTLPLRIVALALVFIFMNVPDARMILVYDRQGWSLAFVLCSLLVNLALNLVLARPWGAPGAAIARLCSSAVFFLLNHIYVTQFFVKFSLVRALFRPALATLIMALIVWAVPGWPLLVSISLGVIFYAGALWIGGGVLPEDIALLRKSITELSSRQA